ncbi:MAG: hypothetical protein WKG01_27470, partial [Kofleriaceae bacterium]
MRAACLLLVLSSTAAALPPPDPRVREGANHHLGDDSFVAAYGRGPRASDREQDRMTAHLVHVRARLASRPPTRPALAARRSELLGYLDDYIANGQTPVNTQLPWRSPVFIDEAGAICAVGYLIERSVGRALAERIAREHGHDYLEDIAAQMPDVQAWIGGSGLTLEELASIQPAYSEPEARTWVTWNLTKHPRPDGADDDGKGTRGAFRDNKMEGEWTVTNEAGLVVGKGTLARGAGRWTSFHPDGTHRLAEGRYANSRAHGDWKFFHPSGNLAAEGRFVAGTRVGAWRFYYDTPARIPIALGKFSRAGEVRGTWHHFDAHGALIATSRTETPDWGDRDLLTNGGAGFTLTVTPGDDQIRYAVHQGTVSLQRDDIQATTQRLESYALGDERIYIHDPGPGTEGPGFTPGPGNDGAPVIYDPTGARLDKHAAGWRAADCRWSATREQVARSGDLARLHGLLFTAAARRARAANTQDELDRASDPGPQCATSRPISTARGAVLDRLLARRDQIRSQSPVFVKRALLDEPDPADRVLDPADADDARLIAVRAQAELDATDLTRVLARHMVMYLEWPHIDGRFLEVFQTMAGRYHHTWFDGDP